LGSVVRTLFLLDWISKAAVRQGVTATTNKVECYHGFAKWLSFGGEQAAEKVIAENDPDEQQKQIRYNDLLASAVILQHAIDMARIVEDLRRQGWQISDEDVALHLNRRFVECCSVCGL
jgi:TnpA family transposase